MHIDGGDILNFTYYYNLSPHPSFQVEKMGGIFLKVKVVIVISFLNVVLKPLPHLPFPCEKLGGAFFWV